MGFTIARNGYRGLIGVVGDIGNRRQQRPPAVISNIAKAAASGSLTAHGVMPTVAEFSKQLRALGDVDQLDLYVSSEGGDCLDCIGIYNLLARHPATIHCVIDGIVAGSAVIPVMAADKILIGENAHVALQLPQFITYGNSREHREAMDVLTKIGDSMATTIARRAGRHVSTIQAMMDRRALLSGSEAVQQGLADKLLPLKRGTQSVANRLNELAIHDRVFPGPIVGRSTIAARLRQLERDALALR